VVPEQFAKSITAATLKKHAMYEILLSQGIEFGRVIQEVTAFAADPTFARWLDTEVGAPLLRLFAHRLRWRTHAGAASDADGQSRTQPHRRRHDGRLDEHAAHRANWCTTCRVLRLLGKSVRRPGAKQ